MGRSVAKGSLDRSDANPKTGTVTTDVAKAVTDIKGGKSIRVDKNSNLHFLWQVIYCRAACRKPCGCVEETACKAKLIKGRYIQKAVVSTTVGPGIGPKPVPACI